MDAWKASSVVRLLLCSQSGAAAQAQNALGGLIPGGTVTLQTRKYPQRVAMSIEMYYSYIIIFLLFRRPTLHLVSAHLKQKYIGYHRQI